MNATSTPSGAASRSAERLRILSELANEYAYTATLAGDFTLSLDWVTPNCERKFGFRSGLKLELDSLRRLVPEEDHPPLDEWLQYLQTGFARPQEHRFRSADGKVYWLHHFVQVTPVGGKLRIDGAALDITDRKQAEIAMARSETRFRTIAEKASDLLVELNQHGRVVYVNPALRDLLGWDPELLIGTNVLRRETRGFVHPEDVAHTLHSLRQRGTQEGLRARARHSDGGWRWLEFSVCTYLTTEGTHQLFVGRDITEQLAREAERRAHSERLQELVDQRTEELERASSELRQLHSRYVTAEKLGDADELANRLARAINSPLSALLGRVQMELEEREPSRDGLRRILLLAERIQAVVASTLTLFREGRLQLAECNAHDLLKALAEHLADSAHARGVELEVAADPDLPAMLIDHNLITSALASIADNGIAAMSRGGQLRIRAVHLRDVEIVEFRISDQGTGIAPQHLPKIFDPFFTTKIGGTGLGLTIANGVIRGHRGQIEIQTQPGAGTRVDVRIPYSKTCDLRGLGPVALASRSRSE